VAKTIKQTADENKGEPVVSATAVNASLNRRFDIEGITYPVATDVAVTRVGKAWALSIDYEDTVPLFANIKLLVHFQKRAVVE
jgi:hypothetical protein